MDIDDVPTIDIVDSTGSAQADVPRSGRRKTWVVVGAAVPVVVAVGLFTALHANGAPAIQPPGAVWVPVGAPGSMLTREQVPSWRPSTSATIAGGSAGSLTRQQVPSWSPTAPTLGHTYREQVPAGS